MVAMTVEPAPAVDENPSVSAPGERRRPWLLRALRRVIADPRLLLERLNAQRRLRWVAGVPFSVRLRGRAVAGGGGRITLGERVLIHGQITPTELIARPGGAIEIGEGTFINYGTSISAHQSVTIGRDCHLGHYVFIYDNDHHEVEDKFRLPESRPVILEDRVWLGTRAVVLKGVRIGHDTVVGAGSVVTRDLPPRCVAAGTPARIIRRF